MNTPNRIAKIKRKLHEMRYGKGSLSCDYCPPHRGENCTRTPRRSWKTFRDTQYKPVEIG